MEHPDLRASGEAAQRTGSRMGRILQRTVLRMNSFLGRTVLSLVQRNVLRVWESPREDCVEGLEVLPD